MLKVHVQVPKHPRELREDPIVLAGLIFFVARVSLLLFLPLLDANPVGHHWEQC